MLARTAASMRLSSTVRRCSRLRAWVTSAGSVSAFSSAQWVAATVAPRWSGSVKNLSHLSTAARMPSRTMYVGGCPGTEGVA